MNRAHTFSLVVHHLTQLQMRISMFNSLNMQDINIHAENFFRDLLNLSLGYNLININISQRNAQSIDLGDETARVAIQVTSTSDFSKIEHTYTGFVTSGLPRKYDRLIILIATEKKQYRKKTLGGSGEFCLSISRDVWDIKTVASEINNLSLEAMIKCSDFLRDNISISAPRPSNEVQTLVRLITVLSESESITIDTRDRGDPDPEGKIIKRFADHAAFLKKQYSDLFEIYGQLLKEFYKYSDISQTHLLKLQIYLRSWSDHILTECAGDPLIALELLVRRVLTKMEVSGLTFDECAVRFYLVDQLIACNVFPNKRPEHA